MIANRHPFVIGQQRIVGTKQTSDCSRVMDRGIEIGVIADARRQRVLRLGLRQQTRCQCRPLCRARSQDTRQRQAQRRPGLRPGRHEFVQNRMGSGHSRSCGSRSHGSDAECTGFQRRCQIQNLIPDRDAATKRLGAAGASELGQRQVLYREIRSGSVGGSDPAVAVAGRAFHSAPWRLIGEDISAAAD